MVEQLVAHNLVNTPADLYQLNATDLMNLERTGERSISSLLEGIEKVNPARSPKYYLDSASAMLEKPPPRP